jgi:hypothetical protein
MVEHTTTARRAATRHRNTTNAHAKLFRRCIRRATNVGTTS